MQVGRPGCYYVDLSTSSAADHTSQHMWEYKLGFRSLFACVRGLHQVSQQHVVMCVHDVKVSHSNFAGVL